MYLLLLMVPVSFANPLPGWQDAITTTDIVDDLTEVDLQRSAANPLPGWQEAITTTDDVDDRTEVDEGDLQRSAANPHAPSGQGLVGEGHGYGSSRSARYDNRLLNDGSDDVPYTNEYGSYSPHDGYGSRPKPYNDGYGSTQAQKPYNDGYGSKRKPYNDGYGSTQRPYNDWYGSTLKPYNDGYGSTPKPYSNGYGSTQKPYNDGYSSTPKPYNDGYGSTPKPYNDGYGSTPKQYNDGYGSTTKPYNDGYGSYDNSYGSDNDYSSETDQGYGPMGGHDARPPHGGWQCPQTCDVSAWPHCQCLDRYGEMFTEDGRGNCNVGATKQDRQVWCFVDPLLSKCPDTRESSKFKGRYWSRFACITEIDEDDHDYNTLA